MAVQNFQFQGRAEINKGKVVGWNDYTGPTSPKWKEEIPVSNGVPSPDYEICGFHIDRNADISGVRMRVQQSSSSSSFEWKLHVAAVSMEEGTRNVSTRFLHSDQSYRSLGDTDLHLIEIAIDDFLYPNDIVTVMWERSGEGSNRYYLYVRSGIILTR